MIPVHCTVKKHLLEPTYVVTILKALDDATNNFILLFVNITKVILS